MKKSRSLRNEIIRPYSYLIMGLSIGLILISIFFNFSNSLRYITKLESEHSSHIKNEIIDFLDSPFKINQQNFDLYKLDVIQNLSPSDLRVIFANQYQHVGHITLIGLGLEDGTYIDVQYLDGKDLYSSERNPETGDSKAWRIDRSGSIISLDNTSVYDHRNRPWYSASKEKKPGWTPPYTSINPKSIFLTAFYPLHSDSKEFWGTMVSSISLTEIGNIIRSVDSLGNKDIYILERDGKIIASNQHEIPFKIINGEPARIYATESQNKVLSALFHSNNIIENDIKLTWIGFTPYFVGAYSINDGRGIDWQMFIIDPAAELFYDIAIRLLTILFLALFTVAIGVWIGRRIGVGISKPILEIKNAANQIVQGNLKKRVEVYKDNEVGEMGISFNMMGETIHDLINKLEEKVDNRTRELIVSNKALLNSEEKFRSLSDAAFEGIIISEKGIILETNNTMSKIFGYQTTELVGMKSTDLVAEELREEVKNKILSNYEKPYETTGLTKDGDRLPVAIHAKVFSYKRRQVRVTAVRDLTDQKKAEEEIKTLRSILPICSHCKKIRNEDGCYEQIEAYIHKFSDVDFSHTVCPQCMKKHYQDVYEKISPDKNNE